jgi:uncharacterized protein Yka (UPF0111/DUF47 family)
MHSLQVLFAPKDVFFDLLEASAEEARASVQALTRIIAQPENARSIEEFVQSRRKDKQITARIHEELCKTFVTPLDREDIEALSNALYKIPKTVEKFAERLILAGSRLSGMNFKRQVALLEQATDTVVGMVRLLRERKQLERLRDLNAMMQQIEGQADELMLDLLREVYSGKYEPLQALLLKDLYELLEKVVDRCRDAGNVISHVVLKHS